jgi:hypothetical protein
VARLAARPRHEGFRHVADAFVDFGVHGEREPGDDGWRGRLTTDTKIVGEPSSSGKRDWHEALGENVFWTDDDPRQGAWIQLAHALQKAIPEHMPLTVEEAKARYKYERDAFAASVLSTTAVPKAWTLRRDLLEAGGHHEILESMLALARTMTLQLMAYRDAVRIAMFHRPARWTVRWHNGTPKADTNHVSYTHEDEDQEAANATFGEAKETAGKMLALMQPALASASRRIRERDGGFELGDLTRFVDNVSQQQTQHVPKCFVDVPKYSHVAVTEMDEDVKDVFEACVSKYETDPTSLHEATKGRRMLGEIASSWKNSMAMGYPHFLYAKTCLISDDFLTCVKTCFAALPGEFRPSPNKGFQRAWTKCGDDYDNPDTHPPPRHQYLKDMNRCTQLLLGIKDISAAMEALSACGELTITLVKNRLDESTHDVLVNVVFLGVIAEVQLHFHEILELKKITHRPYNILRMDGGTDALETNDADLCNLPEKVKFAKMAMVFDESPFWELRNPFKRATKDGSGCEVMERPGEWVTLEPDDPRNERGDSGEDRHEHVWNPTY